MAIYKNDIPILEYDSNQTSIIMPNCENLNITLPEKAVYAFLGDLVDEYALKNSARVIYKFISATKCYPIYVLEYEGEDICLVQAPVGSAASVQILDWLICYGVKKVISTGSCGVLVDIDEDEILVCRKALRDEGTSYHYLPPSRFIELDNDVIEVIEYVFEKINLPYKECITWTTDGFFRETKDMVLYRIEEGCETVEMECSALAACARFRGIKFGQILFSGDTLAKIAEYDIRNFGLNSREKALKICFEIAKNL